MFCRKCGQKIPDDSVFCSLCGGRILDETEIEDLNLQPEKRQEKEKFKGDKRVCKYCQHISPAIAVRCTYCGRDIRSKEEKWPKTDFWGPLLTVMIIGVFFLPWFSDRGAFHASTYLSGLDVFTQAKHPLIVPILFGSFSIFTIYLYILNLTGDNGGYKARGITAMLAGLVSSGYFLILVGAFSSDKNLEIALILSLVFSIALFISGTATAFYLSKVESGVRSVEGSEKKDETHISINLPDE